MKSLSLIILPILTLALTICCQGTAMASSTVSISPIGSDAFGLGCDLEEDVVEMEITVEYDAGKLINPKVSHGPLGRGEQFDSQAGSAGVVWLRVSSSAPLKRRWMPARIRFSRLGKEPGTISSLQARLIGKNGEQVNTQIKVNNPAPEQAVSQMKDEARPSASRPETAETAGDLVLSIKTAAAQTVQSGNVQTGKKQRPTRQESVLERFRRLPEGVSLDALLHLFESGREGGMIQAPPVVLTDGSSTLRLTVKPVDGGEKPPLFVFNRAHCVSLKAGNPGEWIIEALPEKGVFDASLTVMTDVSTIEYPLAVAPPLEPPRAEMGRSDFALFRKNRLLPESAACRSGYLDDYIYAANYLALRSGCSGNTVKPK